MKSDKKARLERAGWVVGDAAQFLTLSAQEQRFVELKLALATGVRQLRERRGLTQAALAKRLGSKTPLNNARAAMEALSALRTHKETAKERGISLEQIYS